MAVGADGLLYVIDPASVVTVIDPATGRVVRRFGRRGPATASSRAIATPSRQHRMVGSTSWTMGTSASSP